MNLYQDIGFASEKHKLSIRRLVSPLRTHLGIDVFFQYSISHEGEFRFFTTHSEQAEYFWEHELFRGHPHLRHPRFYRPGPHFIQDLKDTEFDASQGRMESEQSIHQLHLLFDCDFSGFKAYGFATTQADRELRSVYLDQGHLLQQFIGAFNREAPSTLFRDMESRAIDMRALDPAQFYTCPRIYQNLAKQEAAFNESLSRVAPSASLLSELSRREKECAYWLLRGRSASQIAEKMKTSPRTAESQIVSIKNKINASSKQDLFDLLQEPLIQRGLAFQ